MGRVELAYDDDDGDDEAEAAALEGETYAVLPERGDNAAIARCELAAGAVVRVSGRSIRLRSSCPPGWRFATRFVRRGEALLSWRLPFGDATRDVAAGEVLANSGAIEALAGRGLAIPEEANFADRLDAYADDSRSLVAGLVPRVDDGREFDGYDRGGRGVGTRNFVAVIPACGALGPLARKVCGALAGACDALEDVDGVVALAHTEGSGGSGAAAALDADGGGASEADAARLLRTLAGFARHPNVFGCVVVGLRGASVTAAGVAGAAALPRATCVALDFEAGPEDAFDAFEADVEAAVRAMLPDAAACVRTPQPVAALKIALQCGGSDAFSGVSGNQGRKRVIQRLFNVGVLEAMSEKKASTL